MSSRRVGGAGRRRNRPWEDQDGEGGAPGGSGTGAAGIGGMGGMGGMGGLGGLGGFGLFDPSALAERRQFAAMVRQAEERVAQMAMEHVPEDVQENCQIVVTDSCGCGDMGCEPSGTIVQYLFRSGARGFTVAQKPAFEITAEDVAQMSPTAEVFVRWNAGEEVQWPPPPEPERPNQETDPLRFEIGTRVKCRIQASTWANGEIIKHYYREKRWPPGKWVPYQVKLDDGTMIYAPTDTDRLIMRLEEGE